MNLPNYLYKKILEIIFNYICKNFPIKYYGRYDIKNNNEFIRYSLVNKSWFKCVSKILERKIRNKNFGVFKSFIESPTTPSDYKLIKYQNSTIVLKNLTINGYNGWVKSIEKCSEQVNKILINLNISSSNPVNGLDLIQNNFIFNLSFSNTTATNVFSLVQYFSKENSLNKIKKIKLNHHIDVLFSILAFNVSNIKFYDASNGVDIEERVNNIKLKFKSNDGSLKVQDLLCFPKNEATAYNIPNHGLKKFSVNTNIKMILDNMDQSFLKSYEDREDQLKKNLSSWDTFIDKLSKNKELYSLSVGVYGFFRELEPKLINKGFKSLLSSPSCIKSLSFFGEIDSNIYEGLALNRSIKNVSIPIKYFSSMVKEVLVNNKTIKNLYVLQNESMDILNCLKELIEYSDKIELFSITFEIYTSFRYISNCIDLLYSHHFNIKEFNFLNRKDNNIIVHPNPNNYKLFQLVSNNSIVNISSRDTPEIINKTSWDFVKNL
ncbi:hypothetical protein DICPUDRAFT_78159 [Dictyostelium purpureum]|uniref:Uncharacterized protein n=1 Tax=Dictyostelium purpureum TaxID=5786 RepID=F0ZIQ8_DICPU|nr:uncharacterized protein DICPUDRAFT_78159 [Dictyostelium purpureum]EGC36166.1 hypothetical protein DICPUDRAFT_78159 [Dictyostelium purpureum]|eukprot:XP_003287299.1 hypothetical protein DICPUDRAFT_78159 [Dictyostelium purpureum]